jgi:hypothetical protein
MSKDFSLEEALTPLPQEEFGLSDLFEPASVASSSEEGMRGYVPRQNRGITRQVEGKTYPKKKAAPIEDTTGAMGDDFGAAIMDVAQPKKESVMEGVKIPPLPTEDRAVVNPQFTAAVQAQLNAMPAEQRQAALDKMAKRPDVYGRAARAIAGRYAEMDKAQAPTLKKFDPRLEAQTERFAEQGLFDPESYAKAQALSGQLMPDLQQMTPDVVGEQADIEAQKRAKELADAGFTERVGAGARSQFTKSGMGLLQAYADLTGDDDFSNKLNSARRIEEAREGAIPEGESIFDKSFQGAMTGLAAQAPLLVIGGLTGSSGPILAQAAIQQFGDSYGEGKAAGLSGTKAAARAVPMAAAEVFFERFGMTKALAGLREHVAKNGIDSLPKYVAEAIARELPAELATTATQYGIDVLPSVGLNKNPSLLGLYKQLEETLRQTILQSGVTAGATIGVTKGIQKTSQMLGPRKEAYQRDQSYEGLAELIAKSKGFLTPEPQQQQRQEQQRQEQETPPDLGAVGEAIPGEDLAPTQTPAVSKDVRVTQLAEEIQRRTNIPIENATRIAEERIAAEEGTNAPAQGETQGEPNVGQAIAKPSGVSVQVAGQPGTDTTSGGTDIAEPSRVVPARQDVAGVDERASTEPTPVGKTLIEEFKDLYDQGKVTTEDIEAVQNWMKAEDSAGDFGKKLFDLINEIERRPAAEEVKPVEEAKVEEVKPAKEQFTIAEALTGTKPLSTLEYFEKRDELVRQMDEAHEEGEALSEKIYELGTVRAADVLGDDGKPLALDENGQYDSDKRYEAVKALKAKRAEATAKFDAAVKQIDEFDAARQASKGKPSSAETVTETKKRGRPPLERPEEQKQKIALTQKEQKKLTDNADYQLKKLRGMLDEAAKPIDEELEADKVDAAEVDKEKAKKYVATKLLELTLNPNLRGTAVGNRAKALLNDRSKLSQADIDAAKRGMEIRAKTDLRGEMGESFQGESALGRNVYTDPLPSKAVPSKAKPNTAFNRATNASQALTIVARTGNDFQKSLANRLRPYINGVTFVVLEKNDPMPAALRKSMESANGL